MDMKDFSTYSIKELRESLRTKQFSAREVTLAFLKRITALDQQLNSYITVTEQDALETADRVDKKIAQEEHTASLAGIPVAYKDVFCTRGTLTTAASHTLENYIPPYDATSVARLKAHDAVMLGKVNTDEFTMGSSTETSVYGATKNPWDTTKVPGGSSGGSAAAVAAGLATYSLATDTGGSIRQPASFCGVVGLKPTYGRVSRYGVMSMASSLDTIGIIARSVADTAEVLKIIAGSDAHDSTTPPKEVEDYTVLTKDALHGVRIGIPHEYFAHTLDTAIADSIRNTKEVLLSLGAELIEVSLPHTEYAVATYYLIASSEVSSNMARYDGVRYGLHHDTSIHDALLSDLYGAVREKGFSDEVKRRAMLGTYALSAGYYDAYYKKAQKVRTKIKEDFTRAFREVDVLLTPTTPTTAFSIGEKIDDPLQMYLADIYTIPANLAGIPGISLPIGLAGGLPIGIQLMGPQCGERSLLNYAYALEQALDLSLAPTLEA